jgi:hypothetical protein
MSNEKQLEEVRQWIATLRQLLELRQGQPVDQTVETLREELSALSSGESPLPSGVRKLLMELADTVATDVAQVDADQLRMVEDFRQQLQALLVSLRPVLEPGEKKLQQAWLQLSAQSCQLRRYELALKVLQDAWHQAKAIEAEERMPDPERFPQQAVLKPGVERALQELDKLSNELDALEPGQQVEFVLMANLTHQSMTAGDHATALGLVGEWYRRVQAAIDAQGRQRAADLRKRIDDEVYTPNAELKTLEAALASVPRSDAWFDRDAVGKAEWEGALREVEQDRQAVASAVVQARLACEQLRQQWARDSGLASDQLALFDAVATDPARDTERKRLEALTTGVDIVRLGMKKLASASAALGELAEEWRLATQANQEARGRVEQRRPEVQLRLERARNEAPGEYAALGLVSAAAQQLADQRDWIETLAKLDECLRLADEKIKAHRVRVQKSIGANCDAEFLGKLFDKLGAEGVKELSTAVGAKTLGELSRQFSADDLEQMQAEAGGGKGLKTVLDDVCGGQAAQLKSLREGFGSLAALQSTAREAFGGKFKTLGSLLTTGFGGDAGKLRDFLAAYPTPDAEKLKAKDPAALAAQKDQQNLKALLDQGGLNDNAEVFAHLVKSGCGGDPAKVKDLHAKFSATTPPGLAGMKALLDTAGLKVPPERLAEILQTGCGGRAEHLKDLAIGFDGKMPQLKECVGQWGADSGAAIKGLTDDRHLKGDYQALQKRFAETLNTKYPGLANRSTREFLIGAAPKFTRKELPADLNSTLAHKLAPKDEDVGSFTGTDWNHLLTHVCERHLPSAFAFKDARAAATPINFNNSQLPPDWTTQDIADMLQNALQSAACKKAIADCEPAAVAAEAWGKRKEWEKVKGEHDRWAKKARKHQEWLVYDDWSSKGGKLWRTYLSKGKSWQGKPPRDPGPEPGWPGKSGENPPGPEPTRPGAEPPVVPKPDWDPETFWHGDLRFQIGVDYRDGRRQITQLFPIAARGGLALTPFPMDKMNALCEATIK